jgi:hypothetical protein
VLPDLTDATRQWCRQWLLMLTWLLTSVLALLIMAPMATAYQWSLISDSAVIAAAMGIVGSVLHIRERDLAVNNSEYCMLLLSSCWLVLSGCCWLVTVCMLLVGDCVLLSVGTCTPSWMLVNPGSQLPSTCILYCSAPSSPDDDSLFA